MKIGIIDADLLDNGTRHPNLALMKISCYYKEKGYDVELIKDYKDDTLNSYAKIFVSKVFSFTKFPEKLLQKDNIVLGGTGFFADGGESLSDEIEHHFPDYHLYDDYIEQQVKRGKSIKTYGDYIDYSIGFATRGCFRKCEFCVNKKYDRVFRHANITEFLDNSRKNIYLWDDNFLGYNKWEEVLDELDATKKPFQFRQGLDIRLMDEEKAKRLSKCKYHGDFIFAFDHIKDKSIIQDKLKLWKRYCAKTTKLYVLCAYDSQDVQDVINTFERIKILMRHGCLPYIMRYESYKTSEYKNMYTQLARWCNQPQFLKKKSFREFCVANQSYHKNPDTNCASYNTLLDFEQKHPEVARKYFDLRYDEENEYNGGFGYGRKYLNRLYCEKCINDLKAWKDAYNGILDIDKVISNYMTKEIDLQCLTAKDIQCDKIGAKEVAEWFIDVLLKKDVLSIVSMLKNSVTVEPISPSNIPQFSKFEDAYLHVLDILIKSRLDDLTYEKMGFYLERKQKTELANKKYGENHSKLAALLDLVVITKEHNKMTIKSSILGEAYHDICIKDKKRLIVILLLRIPIIQQIMINAIDNKTTIVEFLTSLSKETLKRRKPNIIELLRFIKNNSDLKTSDIFMNISEG